jgi:DNA processing protein
MALEQDRQVFAVPGSPLSGKTRGSNRLLKEGAKLVECVEDVIEELAPQMVGRPLAAERASAAPAAPTPIWVTSNKSVGAEAAGPEELAEGVKTLEMALDDSEAILNNLKESERLHVDSIIESSGLNAQTVLRLLLELELEGRVTQHPGKLFSLA